MKPTYFLILCLLPTWLFSQQQSLAGYVQMGLENNRQLNKQQLALNIQELKVLEARGKALPNVTFSSSYLLAQGGRTFDFPIGDLFNPVYAALNQVSGSDAFPTDAENQSIQLLLNNFHDTRLFINQPIYNPAIRLNRQAQNELIGVEQAQLSVQETELVQQIEIAYYNYLKTFQVAQIYDSTEQTLLAIQRFNEKWVKSQKKTEDVLVQVVYELQKLQSDKVQLQQQQATAKAYFNLLIGRDLGENVIVDNAVLDNTFLPDDMQQLIQQALNQRSELTQLDKALAAQNYVTQLNQSSRLPTLGVEASAGFQGVGFDITEDQALATVGIGLNWTLFEGKQANHRIAQAQLQSQQLALDKAQLQDQIKLQVIQTSTAYQAAQQKLKAEEAARRSAQKSFDLVSSRYRQQQALFIEYLDARNKLTTAEISLSLAQFDLLIAQSQLKRAAQLKN